MSRLRSIPILVVGIFIVSMFSPLVFSNDAEDVKDVPLSVETQELKTGHGLFRVGMLEDMRTLNTVIAQEVWDWKVLGWLMDGTVNRHKESKTPFAFGERIGYEIYKKGLAKHLLLRPLGNVIYLFLPLCVKKDQLEFILDNFYAIIREMD